MQKKIKERIGCFYLFNKDSVLSSNQIYEKLEYINEHTQDIIEKLNKLIEIALENQEEEKEEEHEQQLTELLYQLLTKYDFDKIINTINKNCDTNQGSSIWYLLFRKDQKTIDKYVSIYENMLSNQVQGGRKSSKSKVVKKLRSYKQKKDN